MRSESPVALDYVDQAQLSADDKSDVTLYYDQNSEQFRFSPLRAKSVFQRLHAALGDANSCDVAVRDGRGGSEPCRGLVCWCHARQAIAVTLRGHKLQGAASRSGELPDVAPTYTKAPHELAAIIRRTLKTNEPEPKGLVVVCGETGSGKSKVANGLLRALVKPGLKPETHNHIIALGAPVDWTPVTDTVYASDKCQLAESYAKYGVRYTPRTLGRDTTLAEALQDALRQKPSAVYLDEVRRSEDWAPILRFAQSGHLIITTAHAGSITDLILWLFQSMHIERRSEAPTLAKNILAAVHAQLRPDANGNVRQEPEIWLGRRGSRQLGTYGPGALVAAYDGDSHYIARDFVTDEIYSKTNPNGV
jgi:energy-coupling factor transporter ATP-binding protein EcfA2